MSTAEIRASRSVGLLLLAYLAFISLGLPDGLLGVAWPTMRGSFGSSLDSLGLMMVAGTCGYIGSSFVSGHTVSRLGVGGLLALSCFLTGSALIGYTLVPAFGGVVALAFVSGLGAGAIDAGLNTWVAANYGERTMQWLHASFGIGVTLGPIIMTVGLAQFGVWRWGYQAVGVAQWMLALVFLVSIKAWSARKQGAYDEKLLTDYRTPMSETLQAPAVWGSLAMFFVYTGIELLVGVWVYSLLVESRGVPPTQAGALTGSYWAMFTVGRFLAGLFSHRFAAVKLLWGGMLLALAGSIVLVSSRDAVASLVGVAMVGFAIAPIFPALVSGTRSRVGAKHTANTIGMQIGAAGLGATLIPGGAGVIAQRTSLEAVPWMLVGLCLVLIVLVGALPGRAETD